MVNVMPGKASIRASVLGLALAVGSISACTAGGSGPDAELTVFAAASLTDVFGTLSSEFEAAHPGTRIVVSYGGSSTLAAQINNGAPAEVFASASEATFDQVRLAGNAGDPRRFASNSMIIAVPALNPANITDLAGLARADVKLALCQPQVPCGAAAEEVLRNGPRLGNVLSTAK